MTAGWRDRAACIGHDQNLWYPVRGGSNAKALAICEACPVVSDPVLVALFGARP